MLGYLPHQNIGAMFTSDYREVMIESAGHWLQQERPDEIDDLLVNFLAGVTAG